MYCYVVGAQKKVKFHGSTEFIITHRYLEKKQTLKME